MNDITNNKLAGINKWANFPGFSLLFDNPGDNYILLDGGLTKVNCNKDELKSIFYSKLHEKLSEIILDFPANNYLFCPLPLSSYHVTFWDGVNCDNERRLNQDCFHLFHNYLNGFFSSFQTTQIFHSLIDSSLLSLNSNMGIEFEFDKLTNWGKVLVARLKPKENDSIDRLNKITAERNKLTINFKDEYGDIFNENWNEYSPHVSLGYFANQDYSKLLEKDFLEKCEEKFRKELFGLSIKFSSISFYGFTDMTTFFKINTPNNTQ